MYIITEKFNDKNSNSNGYVRSNNVVVNGKVFTATMTKEGGDGVSTLESTTNYVPLSLILKVVLLNLIKRNLLNRKNNLDV